MNIPLDPVKTLVTFIIGSVVSDNSINEKDYLYIYPSLVKAFGNDFDFISAKQAIGLAKDIKKEITKYTKEMISIINVCDEELATDIISLCLLITSVLFSFLKSLSFIYFFLSGAKKRQRYFW